MELRSAETDSVSLVVRIKSPNIALGRSGRQGLSSVSRTKRATSQKDTSMYLTRRGVLAAGAAAGLGSSVFAGSASASVVTPAPSRELLRRAMAALDKHKIPQRDLFAIADFSQPSRLP